MNKTPLISVIVPAYNAEKTIEKCVNSILKSTYKNIEVIVVNDGSTDRTEGISKELEDNDNRVKVYSKQNSGAGLSREYGLNIANGKYVAFVDADDYIEENMYQVLYEQLQRTKSDVCYCGYVKIYMDGKKEYDYPRYEELVYEKKKILKEIIHNTVYMSTSNDEQCMNSPVRAIYSMNIIKNNNIHFMSEREVGAEDAIFNYQVLSNVERIAFVNECLYNYIIYDISLSHNPSGEATRMIDCTTQNWYKYISEYAKEKGIEEYIMPYLNTEYVGRFRKRVGVIKDKKLSKTKFINEYKLVKKEFEYIPKINVWKLVDKTFRYKFVIYLMINHIKVYMLIKNKLHW